jgi:hypothetical protein
MRKINESKFAKYVLLIVIVTLLAIIAFSTFALLFPTYYIEGSTSKTINVDLQADIRAYSSTIYLSLNNHDNRPYHFVKLEIIDARSNTIVYLLKIDVTLMSKSFTSFSVSVPSNVLQQHKTYIITLYTEDGYKISTTAGA